MKGLAAISFKASESSVSFERVSTGDVITARIGESSPRFASTTRSRASRRVKMPATFPFSTTITPPTFSRVIAWRASLTEAETGTVTAGFRLTL